MKSRSREALLASIAAALGVTPLACGGASGDAQPPLVAAHEVAPAVASQPSASVAEPLPSAAPSAPSETSAAPSLSAPSPSAPAPTAASPPASEGAVPLALFSGAIASAGRAPPHAATPATAPKAAPAPVGSVRAGGLSNIHGGSCGGSASCGASVRAMPVASVQISLAPRDGASPEDARRAARAISIARGRARACVEKALASDPTIASGAIVIDARSPGGGAAASFTVESSTLGAWIASCVAHSLSSVLGGDAEATGLRFRVSVAVQP